MDLAKRLNRDWAMGRAAFEAYSQSTGGLTYDGHPIPPWEDISTRVQNAWIAAAHAGHQEYVDD